jgi:uncharacterized membrane protein
MASQSTSRELAEATRASAPVVDWARATLVAIVALSAIGAAIAGYLTYTHYDHDALVCSVGDCGTVQQSEYATIGPVPIALLGLGMFVAVGTIALARFLERGPLSFAPATIVSWALLFAGILYYAYLTWTEVTIIEAICQWCVASSIVALILLAAESVLLWRFVIDSDA